MARSNEVPSPIRVPSGIGRESLDLQIAHLWFDEEWPCSEIDKALGIDWAKGYVMWMWRYGRPHRIKGVADDAEEQG